MEEIFAFIFLAVIFLGYLAICAGVGYFAHKNDQSFVLFFILAIIFSPIPVFVVVIIVSVATGTLGASHEQKEQATAGQEVARDDGDSSSDGDVTGQGDEDLETPSVQQTSEEETHDSMSTPEVAGSAETESPADAPAEEDEDEPYPWEEEDVGEEEQQSFGEEWEESDDSDLGGEPEAPEGKVRCDVCHSFVDEEEERCPACGNRLG